MTLPKKTREVVNRHLDSRYWNAFAVRSDDIVIASYSKSGTTWVQQVVAQLLFHGRDDVDVNAISPWLESHFPNPAWTIAQLGRQEHRRFIKTHLPLDALVFHPEARYIYVARDGREVAWSLYRHYMNATERSYDVINAAPGRGPFVVRPTGSARDYFLDWLERDGHPLWPFWHHVRSWWDHRSLGNLLLVHFEDLCRDLSGEVDRVAAFLGLTIADGQRNALLTRCSFDYMKAHADQLAPGRGAFLRGGARSFFVNGTTAQWKGELTDGDCRRYLDHARAELADECACWLLGGARRARDAAHETSQPIRNTVVSTASSR